MHLCVRPAGNGFFLRIYFIAPLLRQMERNAQFINIFLPYYTYFQSESSFVFF